MLLIKSVQEANEKSLKSIVYIEIFNMVIVFPTLEPCSVFGNSTKTKNYIIFVHYTFIKTKTKL